MGFTTKDLAQLCGVSRTTVYRALNGIGRIHPETKELILRTASEHGYRPDLLARGLAKGKTSNIGIVVLDVQNRYFSELLSVIGAEANRRGYCMNIMLHGGDRELEREQMIRLADGHMDGIILSSVNEGREYRDFLESLQVPVVSLDNKIAEGIPFVGIDQRQAMKAAAQAVFAGNYECVVYVCPPLADSARQNTYVHRERRKGFEEAGKAFPHVKKEVLGDWEYLDRVESFVEKPGTAFLCAADSFALDIMKRLERRGKYAPADYGIMGFDNIDILEYVSPRLCTVSNSVRAVAAAAAELLFQMIDEKGGGQKPQTETPERLLPYELIPGETIR